MPQLATMERRTKMSQPTIKLGKKEIKALEHLDRNLQLAKEFLNDWLLFNQILISYPNEDSDKAQLENQFLRIKSKLAREHQILKENLGQDYKIAGNTMNIISGATNLDSIFSQSEIAVKKLQGEWHRSFISINETLGGLEDKRNRILKGEKVLVGGMDMPIAKGGGMSAKTRKTLIIIVVVVVVGVVMYVTGWYRQWTDVLGLTSRTTL